MPPKKKDEKKTFGQAVDEDISDAGSLPLLNDFVFFNLYAFKYRRNRLNLEKALFQEFYISPDGETAELAKRNRVIQISDLLNQSKAKGYLTEDEASKIADVDEMKLRQALARSTNEILASITIPLRRIKADQERIFQESLEKMATDEEKENARRARFDKHKDDLELTVWLKDFPRNALDFQELRRSGAQHQPEIEVAVHGIFMVEEMFKRDGDLDEDAAVAQGSPKKDSALDMKEADPEELRKASLLFTKDDRVRAFRDLVYLNKFARNCPVNSQMRLMNAQKLAFFGPDPPLDIPEKAEEEQEVQQQVQTKENKKGNAKMEEEKPVEIPKSPEELAELKILLEFVKVFREQVTLAETDITKYRALSHPTYGVQKLPLWPRKISKEEEEQARIKKDEEEKARKAKEEAEAEQRRLEEEAAKNNKGGRGKAAAKLDPKAAAKEARPAQSANSEGSQSLNKQPSQTKLKNQEEGFPDSCDDRKVDWDFDSFKKIVSEMESSKTTVGSIMAAMVYQIEKKSKRETPKEEPLDAGKSVLGSINNSIPQNEPDSRESQLSQHRNSKTKKDGFLHELDTLFQKLSVEHAVEENDFQHVFAELKVHNSLKESPYQIMYNEQDTIGLTAKAYTFLNGKNQGEFEGSCLQTLKLPGINNRFKMPEKATRHKAEREADTSAILKYCPLDSHMTKRLICLKHFEDLLQSENPERTYEFKHRNCTENLDANTFRQVLCSQLRTNPDINTCYYDKQDALLLAINYKNPPGRLLRRQWTYPIKTMLELPEYRDFVRTQNLAFDQQLLDIAPSRVGVLRTNSKFCFPCDNSVIRVDKYRVGSRRFGSSLVVKDNFNFGLKESQTDVQEKVFGQDELINMETKRSSQRNAELWIEFENRTRMHVAMFDSAQPDEALIPISGPSMAQVQSSKTKVVMNESLNSFSPDADQRSDAMGSPTRIQTALSGAESNLRKSMVNQSNSGSIHDVQKSMRGQNVSDLLRQSAFLMQSGDLNVVNPEDYNPNAGSSITFTFNEGLIVNIKPNGDIEQQNLNLMKETKNKSSVLEEENLGVEEDVSRLVTRNGVIVRTMKDDNKIIYFTDGTITKTDHRRGIWRTTNSKGIVRERNLRTQTFTDLRQRLKTVTKVDPETSAVVEIREDGLLKITYADRKTLFVFPDNTYLLITKSGPTEEGSAVTTTLVKKEGFAPVRIISDPVKARANTIIGLGGTDALMGKDNIMERSNGGVISEVLLPDRTIVQTYFEKQELPGYNKFSQSLVHLTRRDDFSIIKVRQDGEVVLITANERSYLNEIGKQEEFGKSDFDYFFELFGVPNERRSGVYTCNLEQGRMWTQDEEGNYFMIYANGDSTEKLSVSFNLDQMVEGIDNKEPRSPRVPEGEYIEEECKFLPPPKSVAEPRLFLVTQDGATEFFSETQLDYLFRTQHKDNSVIKSEKKICVQNEPAISHRFTKVQTDFVPEQPITLEKDAIPKLPQCLEMVNQTVTIQSEPLKSTFLWRNIVQYKIPTEQELQSFNQALKLKDDMRAGQAAVNKRLKIEPRVLPQERIANQNEILLRIARKRGTNVQSLLAEEYQQVKVIDKNEKRQKVMDALDDYFSPDRADQDTVSENNSDQ